jgi:ankyrin repeat protein
VNGHTPTAYEICKLMNVGEGDIDENKNVNLASLVPDCYNSKCSNNGIFLQIDKKKNQNELITKHYYLIEATKNDDVNYIKDYFDKDMTVNVNEKLEYGYPGNNIVHEIVMNDALTCFEYIITLNLDLSMSNKDGNTPLHLACLKGNYDMVNKFLKLGGSVSCGNNVGDTPLHCASRSGSYNSAIIIIDNGGSSSIITKNNYGETPLHTNVAGNKKNFKLVELLVGNGADVHNIDKYKNTILKTLANQDKSISSEEIRTYLQRIYYQKYDEDEYSKLLNKYPEVRPFYLDTDIEDKLERDFNEYDNKVTYKNLVSYGNEDIKNRNLYVNKETGILKGNIPDKYTGIEHFSDGDGNNFNGNNLTKVTLIKNIHVYLLLLVIIMAVIYYAFN